MSISWLFLFLSISPEQELSLTISQKIKMDISEIESADCDIADNSKIYIKNFIDH